MARKDELSYEEKLIMELEFEELCAPVNGPKAKIEKAVLDLLEKDLKLKAEPEKAKPYTNRQLKYVLKLLKDFAVPTKYYEGGVPEGIVTYNSLLAWKDHLILKSLER